MAFVNFVWSILLVLKQSTHGDAYQITLGLEEIQESIHYGDVPEKKNGRN